MKRIIIKVGTKVLSRADGTLDTDFLKGLVGQIIALRKSGVEIVLVTSGAVGAGRSMLTPLGSVSETIQKQMFAAVGQVKLMSAYAKFFAEHGYYCAQVLATKEDFQEEEHYQNMHQCIEGMLSENVIPIVNENDVVATVELMFTDNDELAGLVAKQMRVDALVILTSTDGILDDAKQTISQVTATNAADVERFITPDTSTGGRGGMVSKFKTARELSGIGIEVFIMNGRRQDVLAELAQGEYSGTRFAPIH